MDTATLSLILSAASGPASGVIVALLMTAAFGYFLIKHVLPQQDKHLDRVIKDSIENRKVFQNAVDVMSSRLDTLEDDVSEIKQIIIKKR